MSLEQFSIPGSYLRESSTQGTDTVATIAREFYDLKTDPVGRPARDQDGWLMPKPYSRYRRVNTGVTGSHRNQLGSNIINCVGDLGFTNQYPMNVLDLPPNLKNDCVIQALSRLKDQSINLGVAFAEAQQTADLIGSTASRLARAAQQLRQGKGKAALRTLRAKSYRNIPNHWLEAQYAWKPLLGDVHGAAQELARQELRHFRATVTGSVSVEDRGSNVWASGIRRDQWRWIRTASGYVRLDYIPGNTFVQAMSRAGMTNPFEIAWEKVPFSFVVDWFLPIGDWLSSFDSTLGWQFKSGTFSTLRKVDVKVTPGPPGGSHGFLYGDYGGRHKVVQLNREVLSSSPFAARPSFKNPLSLGHMANGLSLLSSIFGGRR